MSDPALAFESIAALAAKIRAGALSPVALTEALLERIAALDGRLHAFIAVTRERALAEARAAELALRGGQDLGPLHGIPYAAKDLFDVRGVPTTAGTRLLAGNVAKEDAAVVRRLAGAGMVLLGKTYTVQFAFGGVGVNHDQGTPHNPWKATHHVPGGSSSGSAVAVAAGLAPMALGSDTGGSVRVPASLCGTVGLKTTVGRVSRAGVYPLSFTLDSVGPLTRTVERRSHQALQGTDPRDEISTDGGRRTTCSPAWKPASPAAARDRGDTVLRRGRSRGGPRSARGRQGAPLARRLRSERHGRSQRRPGNVGRSGCSRSRPRPARHNARFLDEHFDELDPAVAHRMIGGRQLSAPDYFAPIASGRSSGGGWRAPRRFRSTRCSCRRVPALSRPLAEVDRTTESYASAQRAASRTRRSEHPEPLRRVRPVRLHARRAPDRPDGSAAAVPGGHGPPASPRAYERATGPAPPPARPRVGRGWPLRLHAARGQGRAHQRRRARHRRGWGGLSPRGGEVVIGDVLETEGRAVEAGIRAAGGDAFVRLDVTDEGDWDRRSAGRSSATDG